MKCLWLSGPCLSLCQGSSALGRTQHIPAPGLQTVVQIRKQNVRAGLEQDWYISENSASALKQLLHSRKYSGILQPARGEALPFAQPCLGFPSQKKAVKSSWSHVCVGRGLGKASTPRRCSQSLSARGEHPCSRQASLVTAQCRTSTHSPQCHRVFLVKG